VANGGGDLGGGGGGNIGEGTLGVSCAVEHP